MSFFPGDFTEDVGEVEDAERELSESEAAESSVSPLTSIDQTVVNKALKDLRPLQ